MDFRQKIADLLREKGVSSQDLEIPPDSKLGDFALPCFDMAKERKKAPNEIAKELADSTKADFLEKVVATGPYVNFFVNKEQRTKAVLSTIFEQKDTFGNSQQGKGNTIVIDYSQPNIGKPMGIHHLGSTVIGHALYNILDTLGFKTVSVNHLGDWGTQFGILIAAFKKWGDEEQFKADPIKYLLSLYVRYNAEQEKNPALHEEAKAWFKKLEDGDAEATTLWTLFHDTNLAEFKRLYTRLSIEFDSYNGEAFYQDKMQPIVDALAEKKLTEEDQGALIVRMDEEKIPPLIVKKSDEATTYALRDLAAIEYRFKTYTPQKILYVVANQQTLHFRQLFEVAAKLGYDTKKLEHVKFGMMRFPEGKMSTRKGKIIFMEDVLNRAVELVNKIIEEKNPKLANKKEVASAVGIGAVIFGQLMNDRIKDVVFDWDRVLDFEGDTGPYVQYTHARACSVLRKSEAKPKADVSFAALNSPKEYELVTLLEQLPEILQSVAAEYKPHLLTQYLLKLAHKFNEFYHEMPILKAESEDLKQARLLLCDCSRQVLANGLTLLGVKTPVEM